MAKIICSKDEYEKLSTVLMDNPEFLADINILYDIVEESSTGVKWDTHDVVKVLCSGKTLDGFCQCTACGDIFPLHYSEYNFCPQCGTIMRGDTK